MKLIVGSTLALFVFLASCVNSRPVQYIQGSYDTASVSRYIVKEPVIQVSDIISIIVFSDDTKGLAAAPYNLPNTGATGTGYLVDERGDIQFQTLGRLHVEGLTKRDLATLLDSRLKEFLQNPYYNIRFVNFKVTLIGELNREGIYTISNERVNIFEAIGLAGGLSFYARKDNVMVIREANGSRQIGRLNLTNPEIFKSPYYFLQQNDMVVVEQTKTKNANNDQTVARNISLATSVISTLLFVVSVFR